MTEHAMQTILENVARGDRVVISSRGARVLSWVANGRERLFMPPHRCEQDAPHGGVPLLFPQFGVFGPGRKHGVVRDAQWSVAETGPQHAVLVLRLSPEETVPECDLRFRVDLVEESLQIGFSVANTSSETIAFTGGLHTYLRVENIENTVLQGLAHAAYADALEGLASRPPTGKNLNGPANVDRVYARAPNRLTLLTQGYEVEIRQTGFADTVIWNPGPVLSQNLADLSSDDWRHFLCVEAAQITPPVSLPPGGTWSGSQRLSTWDD